jgi:hypothetical protein
MVIYYCNACLLIYIAAVLLPRLYVSPSFAVISLARTVRALSLCSLRTRQICCCLVSFYLLFLDVSGRLCRFFAERESVVNSSRVLDSVE